MATLKISDLSVGDWVYYDEGNTPCSIRSIYRTGIQDCVVLNDNKYSEGVIGFVDSLTPIPITAEILEQNGLEYVDDGNDAVIFLCCDMFWARLCVGDTFWQVGIHSEDRLDAVVCDVKHTHQLQHALRLAGIDKEINL